MATSTATMIIKMKKMMGIFYVTHEPPLQ